MARTRSWLAFTLPALLLAATGCLGDDEVPGGDEGAPETTITARPPALTNQPSRFELASSIADSTFGCTLDGGPETPCGSPFEPVVGDGAHVLEVYAISPAGVRDATPARATWTVDTTPPVTTLLVVPPALDNSVNASFQFESERTASFACAVDGAPFTPCASPYQTPALVDGDHTFDVRATDLAGNVETPSRRHAWTIDSSTPDTTIDSGPSAVTNATQATFAFSSPDAGAGASFTCALDALAATPCTSPWIVDGLIEGVHTVSIVVRDAAGNVDPSPATRTWRVDTTPPTVTITSGPEGWTRDNTPSFDFVRSDGGNPVTTECRITGGGATAFAPCAQHYTAATLPEGDSTFVIRARDQAGLETIVERAFTVDTIAPVITIIDAPADPITTSVATLVFTVTGASTIECAFDASAWEPCTGVYEVPVLVDGQHRFHVRAQDSAGNETVVRHWFRRDTEPPTLTIDGPVSTADRTPTFSINVRDSATGVRTTCVLDDLPEISPCGAFIAPTLADGAHLLTVTAVDQAGHVTTATHAFTIDTRNIDVTFTSLPPSPGSDPQPTISFTVIGATASVQCRVDQEPWQDCTSPWTVPTPLTDGQHNVAVKVYNGYNAVVISTSAYFVIDTTP